MKEAAIDVVTIESETGRIIKHQLPTGVQFADLKYGRYWAKIGVAAGRTYHDYPKIRVFWRARSEHRISRFIDMVEYQTSKTMDDIISDAKQGLSQLPQDAAQRLIDKLNNGCQVCLNGRWNEHNIFCPIVESLPEPNCDNMKRQIKSGSMQDNMIDLEWRKLGVHNFDSDCCYLPFKFIYYNDLTSILNDIAAGVVDVSRYVCPHCGKSDIKSKSGFTLHIKSCRK